jgi:rubrerythrin
LAISSLDDKSSAYCADIRNLVDSGLPQNRRKIMAKWVCQVCGYVYEGEEPPKECPVCHAPASKFAKQDEGEMTWASEHVIGVAASVEDDIKESLRAEFQGECSEVGMYLAMSRAAMREGYPEVGLYFEKVANEEAVHAAKYAEMLGEVVTDSTAQNLKVRAEAENGATAGKTKLAKLCKERNYDALHDAIHEMARDEARHGKGFAGLYKRYFEK